MRINSAKDDAAGLAISERFGTQIRGLNQAIRNTNDGVSLAQTAEGGLQESGSILQRMRELSVQSANDTNTSADRESIQEEVDALVDEIDRIATKTTFNNQTLLDGSFTGAKFHIGANFRENLSISVKDSRSDALGRQARYESASDIQTTGAGDALSDGDVVINGVSIRSTVAADDQLSTTLGATSAIAKAAAINDSTKFTGVSAIVEKTEIVATADISAVTMDSTNNISINGEVLTGFRVQDNDADDTLINQINAVADKTGVVASLDVDNRLVLSADDGRNIELSVLGNGTQTGLGGVGTSVTGGRLTLQSEDQYQLQGAAIDKLGDIGGAGATLFGVNSEHSVANVDVTSREGANAAIATLDIAIGQISSHRGELGAVQNRLASTVRNLEVSSENLSASQSRIQDADFAKETATFSRNKIVQQAGVSVLSQANQQPNIALSLLG
jgi:flagellin